MDDIKLIEYLRSGKQDKAFLKLYKNYASVEKLICSKGGSKEDAKDIYQEALLIFYKKAQNTNFQLTASISTYLYSICRYLWKDELQKRKGRTTTDLKLDFTAEESISLQEIIEQEAKFSRIEQALTQIGDKCLLLLKLFYFEGLAMKDIAPKLGLKSEKVAKNQKYKCMERVKLKVKTL